MGGTSVLASTDLSFSKEELFTLRKRAPYEDLNINSKLLLSHIQPVLDLLYMDPHNDNVVFNARRYFGEAQEPYTLIYDYYPCENCKRFAAEDTQALNDEIKKIELSIEKIEKPMRFLKESEDSKIEEIKQELENIIQAGKKLQSLARKRLKIIEYEGMRRRQGVL